MKSIQSIFILFICLAFVACEEEQVMVPEFEPISSDRVVLLEELTGASCPNCPQGTAEIENIKSLYGDQVIPIAIHGDFLAWPINGHSKYDFRNEDAKTLENYLSPWGGKPAASVNRIKYSDEQSNSKPPEWSGLIDKELEKENLINLDMVTIYDPVTRELSIEVIVIPLKDLGENNRITVMILESHIIDAQEDNSTVIEDYEHNHVLRDVITDATGTPIQKDLKALEVSKFNYNYTVPVDEDLWVAENLEVVAFINRDESGVKSVLQAVHAYVIE